MNPTKKNILLITSNSVLLSGGILMIIIPCILASNWWPLLSILMFSVSLLPPALCNACNTSNSVDSYLFDDNNQAELGKMLSWLMAGVFITVGYSIPFEFWRVSMLSLLEFLLTCGGGTIMIISALVFQFIIIKVHSNELN